MFQPPSLKTIAGFAAGVLSLLTVTSVQAAPTSVSTNTMAFSPGAANAVAVDSAGNIYYTSPSGVGGEIPNPLAALKTTAGATYAFTTGISPSAQGVAIDSAGNAYIADTGNNQIKRISPAGAVTVLAGSGTAGYNDDAGLNAQFNAPTGVAVDSSGNIYVADTANDLIRKITPAGVVSTYAGGFAQAQYVNGSPAVARFSGPTGLAVDSAGNLYVADTGNNVIREITAGGGSVLTLAGAAPATPAAAAGFADGFGSNATFNAPQGVAVDASGNVYVADTGNHTIRIITGGGSVATLAGAPGTSGAAALSGTVTTGDATGSTAPYGTTRFASPKGIAVDAVGNIYVADTGNSVIRANVQSLPALGSSAPAIVTQPISQTAISGLSAAGNPNTVVTFRALASGLPAPTYQWQSLATTANATWTPITADTPPTLVGSQTSQLSLSGAALAAANTGTQYRVVASNTINTVVTTATSNPVTLTAAAYTFTSGAVSGTYPVPNPVVAGHADGTGTAATFSSPSGIVAGSGSTLYVVDSANDEIRQISPGNVVTTIAGQAGITGSTDSTGTSILFKNPQGIAIDGTGALYVADSGNGTIRKLSISSGTVSSSTIAGTAGVTGYLNSATSAAQAQFNNPSGVAVDSSLSVYIADTGNNAIRKVTLGGVVTTLAGLPGSATHYLDGTGTAARFNGPTGLAVDASGNVYVADSGNNVIRKITPAGVVTTLAGSGAAGSADGVGTAASFSNPVGLSIDSSGNLYVSSVGNNEIRMITPSGTVITLAGTTTAGSASGTGTAATFNGPKGVTIDSSGIISVADTGNDLVRRGFQSNAPQPSITTQPSSQTTVQGASVVLSVVASANPAPTYQWQRQAAGATGFTNLSDGSVYSGSTSANLTIASVTTAMTGDEFQVIVSNAGGSATSSIATLTVNAPPSITSQPTSQTTTPGGTVTFSVSATGTGTLTYQWYQNNSAISGATAASLTLTNVTTANAGSYTVTVANNGGSVLSNAATLAVGTPPVITTQPSSQSIGIGQSATFTEADTGAVSWQWYFNGTAIGGATGQSYTVANAQTSNAGTYTVVATNATGSTTSNAATLAVTQINYTGYYFGVIQGGGNWALYVNGQNQGTFLAYLPGSQSAIYQTGVTVSTSGAFSVQGSSQTSAGVGLHPQASTVPYQILGQITNGAVTSAGGSLTINGAQDTGTSESYVAGAYSGSGLVSSTGKAYAIVGGDGQALFVWVGANSADAATGTVNGSGSLSGTTLSSGTSFSLNIASSGGSNSISGSFGTGNYAGLANGSASTSRLVNLSARAVTGSGSNTLAAGFSVGGTGTKNVLLRGAGPALALAPFNLTGTLSNPQLNLYQTVNGTSTRIATNAGWGNTTLATLFAQVGAFAFPAFSNDAAIDDNQVTPGIYSEQISSASGSTSGVALAEIYDADTGTPTARLLNLSALATVGGSGLANLSAGFVISGNSPEQILIRGIGPGLTALSVAGAMPAPTLTVYNASGAVIATNSQWGGGASLAATFQQVGAFALAANSLDDAVVLTLAPGLYSAAVQPAAGTSGGVALVEVYEVSH